MARFKRILLKLSGESLMGKQGYGIDPERLSDRLRKWPRWACRLAL